MQAYIIDILAFGTALLCIRWAFLWKRTSHAAPYPPGPKGLPIIGNVLDFPENNHWEAACKWGEQYGDLVFIKVFGTRYLFLNSYEAAADLLEKRGNIYSTRSRNTMMDLEGWSAWSAPVMPYGDELRKIRQFMHRFLQKTVVKDYFDVHTWSTRNLLCKLLEDPEGFRSHVKHSAAESIIMITFGYKGEVAENDPYIELVHKGVEAFAEGLASLLFNALPALRYMPTWFLGTRFHKKVKEGYNLSTRMHREPYIKAKGMITNGTTVPCMTSGLIDANSTADGSVVDEAIIAKAVGVTFAGGGDTTVSVILTFFLAMVLYPRALQNGQEEIDRVVGKNSLPTFEERSQLPYINAICKECLRWQTVSPIGTPHCVEKDDIYNGYFIPAGTTVIANAWAILRNPKEYPEPEKFIPERWLAEEPPLHVNKTAFGFGRRICPGIHLAENAIFIGIASILAVFDIEEAVNASGVPITPVEDYTTNAIRHPKPFQCKITPRSDEAAALIRATSSVPK